MKSACDEPCLRENGFARHHPRQRACAALLAILLCGASVAPTYLAFPDQPFDRSLWKLVGTNPDLHVHPHADHVEVVIGADDAAQGVGFGPIARLSGDFEIRGEYEIQELSRPTSGSGTGPTIYLTTASKSERTALIGRLRRSQEGENYSAYWAHTTASGRQHHPQLRPATGTRGILALKRQGATLAYLTGDSWNGRLETIRTVEFGPDDVNYVRIGVDRGGDRQPIRVLWRRVRVTTGDDDQAAAILPTATRVLMSGRAIILAFLMAAGSVLAIVWWVVRGRHLS